MSKALLEADEIRQLLPHRYPILLVDRILELDEDHALGEKLVSASEPVLQGHFPQRPVFPGVYILEALAQTACVWALRNSSRQDLMPALVGIDGARFRRPVLPGDTVALDVRLLRQRATMYRFAGEARVDGDVVAEAELMAVFTAWEGGE